MPFPDDFVWGVAASAYQIEGAHDADGKGPSVWDEFVRRPGAIFQGHTGDVACDHYHRFREDVELMSRLGVRAYRFSISWPRVMAAGAGRVNAKGLAFYDALVDALLDKGIAPYPTLYHWDLPYALHLRGGWLNRDSAEWFGEYAQIVGERLGDRVRDWMTFNEPQIFIGGGPENLGQMPGLRRTLAEQLLATHHVLLAHGRAVQALRTFGPARIGIAIVGVNHIPVNDDPRTLEAARLATTGCTKPDLWNNALYLDPIIKGGHADETRATYGDALPDASAEDGAIIAQPIDFVGLNIYHGIPCVADDAGRPTVAELPAGRPRTSLKWDVLPESMYWCTRFLGEQYATPMYITENGLSTADWVGLDGRVRDTQRVDFTTRYLRELERAVAEGVDVRGYFHWSILDNFEWIEGYSQRFGLVHVDFETLVRTPKDSFDWYAGVIRSNGQTLAAPAPG
jgi:beta-glucosidase